MYALTKIKGVGRRYSNLVCKKADVDLTKRAGEFTSEELERIVTIIQNPTQYKIPSWFLNRQRDIVDGKDSQILANGVDSKLRDDLERLKKIRAHRGLRHYWVSVSVDNTQRPLGVVAGLSVSPRRRVVKRVVPWDKLAGWSVAFRFHAVHMAFLHFSMRQKTGCILPHLVD